jgi:hypothetical protein
MRVKLESVGNPDFRQDPNNPLFGCESNKMIEVSTFKQAREACMQFISDNDLGSGNWSGGEISDENDKVIAYVSYNGRVWDGEPWKKDVQEIKI